jgi:hypothetical protein
VLLLPGSAQIYDDAQLYILLLQVVVLGSNDACSAVSGGPGTTCLNGGTCLIQTNGNVCRCTSGTRGASCGVAPVTFQSLSYSEQYAVTADSRSVGLSLDVVTNQQGALLFYAVGALGATGGSAFLAVELVSGKPRVSYRQTDSSVVRLSVNRLIDDGTWHHIDVVFSYQVCVYIYIYIIGSRDVYSEVGCFSVVESVIIDLRASLEEQDLKTRLLIKRCFWSFAIDLCMNVQA